MGIFQLLIQNIDSNGTDEFINNQLGKLIAYDQEKGTDFLFTLEEILQKKEAIRSLLADEKIKI